MNTPDIRFKGFTDDWEQRKLGDLIYPNTVFNGDRYNKEDVLSVSDEFGCVNQIEFQGRSFAGSDISHYKVVETGDIVYTRSPLQAKPYGIIKIVGDITGVVSPLYIVNKAHKDNDTLFVYYLFDSPEKTNNYLRTLVRKGAKNTMNISEEEWLSGNVLASPFYEEQRQIGASFHLLDSLIFHHQRKLDTLKNYKKAMLVKMFPREGQKVPEIRFKGFSGDWSQKTLASLCDVFADGDWIESKDQSEFGIRLIQTGNIGVTEFLDKPNNKKWISDETFSKLRCEEVFPGDILISRLPEPAGRACIVPETGTKMITAVDCTIVRTTSNVSNKFLVQHLSSKPYFDEIDTCLAGGTRQRISRSTLASFNVLIPADKAEQDSIGLFFQNLDRNIVLHQHKLAKLKDLKQAMLNKMFVKGGN